MLGKTYYPELLDTIFSRFCVGNNEYENSRFLDLPPELIAQSPLPERSQSRMMIVDRRNSSIRQAT